MRGQSLVITDDQVNVMVGDVCVKTVKLESFVRQIVASVDWGRSFPDCLPTGVRLVQRRGTNVCVVLELPPGPRTVRWIADDSPVPFGDAATYAERRISFPYIVLVLLFCGDELGDARLYYRTQPLSGRPEAAELLLPNLLNVSDFGDRLTWFCTQYIDVSSLPFGKKIEAVAEHFYFSGFNRSSDVHEGHSYFSDSQRQPVDPRLTSVQTWEAATEDSPMFALDVAYRPARRTVADAVGELLDRVQRGGELATVNRLVDLTSCCESVPSPEGVSL